MSPIDPPPSPAPTGLRPDEIAFIGQTLGLFFAVIVMVCLIGIVLIFTVVVVQATRE